MNSKRLLLSLLLMIFGCSNHRSESMEPDSMLSCEQVLEIAERRARETFSDEGGEIKLRFDNDNKEWLGVLKELEDADPETAADYHKVLDDRSYQAIHVWRDPPSIGGSHWMFLDRKTGDVIMLAIGL